MKDMKTIIDDYKSLVRHSKDRNWYFCRPLSTTIKYQLTHILIRDCSYKNNNMELQDFDEFRKGLPIYEYKDKIINAVKDN